MFRRDGYTSLNSSKQGGGIRTKNIYLGTSIFLAAALIGVFTWAMVETLNTPAVVNPFAIPSPQFPDLERSLNPERGRSRIFGRDVVSAQNHYASVVGSDVLKEGGNAIDAVVAMSLAMGVTEPYHTGIGGDALFIVWSAQNQTLTCISGQGRSPATLTRQALVNAGRTNRPYFGAGSVTVPGALSGMQKALDMFGNKTLAQLIQPSIDLAANGFMVGEISQIDWRYPFNPIYEFFTTPEEIATFASPIPGVGDVFKNPGLADSLTRIRDNGIGIFYNGALGQEIIDYMATFAPYDFMKLSDLSAMQASVVELLSIDFNGYKVYEMPPPTQGIIALEALKILEGVNLTAKGYGTADYWHYIIEAISIAQADAYSFVSDPASMPPGLVQQVLSPAKIAERIASLKQYQAQTYAGIHDDTGGTVTVSAADRYGNMAVCISSVFEFFGSGLVPKKPSNPHSVGFALNNRGAGFVWDGNHPNVVGPSKLPFMTLIPAFVTKTVNNVEEPFIAFASMGGNSQPQQHVNVLLNRLLFNQSIQVAVDSARVYTECPSTLNYSIEPYVTQQVIDELERRGHRYAPMGDAIFFGETTYLFGKVTAVEKKVDGYAAACDRRSDGIAIANLLVPP